MSFQCVVAGIARDGVAAGELSEEEYRALFAFGSGIYGTTLDYAHRTLEELMRHDIRDRKLERLLRRMQAEQRKS